MAEATLPPIGTRAVRKEEAGSGKGPVWEVYGHKPKEQEVQIKTAEHKVNKAQGHKHTTKDVPIKEFTEEYTLL